MSTEEKRQLLADLLNRYMNEQNLSGRQLAKRLKLSPTSVSSYLDAVTYPSIESRAQIAIAIGMTSAELEAYLGEETLQPRKPVDETIQDIRSYGQEDFLKVADAVFERLVAMAKSSV